MSIQYLEKLAENNGGKSLAKKYFSEKSKYRWECTNNHIWRATIGSIVNGSWCPICNPIPEENMSFVKNDVIGLTFDKLTVVSFYDKKGGERNMWLCKCVCGNEILVKLWSLKSGSIKSCGCWNDLIIDLVGKRFGRLVVKSRFGKSIDGTLWNCLCDCGLEAIVSGHSLKRGSTKSCGCYGREMSKRHNLYPGGLAAMNRIILQYKRDAEKRKLEWGLSDQDCKKLFDDNCYYCGQEPSRIMKNNSSIYKYNGMDRIDSDKGYSIKNVISCCTVCNIAKRDMTQEDFYNWIKRLFIFNKERLGYV